MMKHKAEQNTLFQPVSMFKKDLEEGKWKGRKAKLAERIEQVVKISQPMIYCLFLVAFFTQALTEEEPMGKPGKVLKPINETTILF